MYTTFNCVHASNSRLFAFCAKHDKPKSPFFPFFFFFLHHAKCLIRNTSFILELQTHG